MPTSPATSRMRLVQAMTSGSIPEQSIPSHPMEAQRQWTNTYKSLNEKGDKVGLNAQQMMHQASSVASPESTGGLHIPKKMDDPKAELLKMWMRKMYNIPGVFYGRR